MSPLPDTAMLLHLVLKILLVGMGASLSLWIVKTGVKILKNLTDDKDEQ